MALSLQPKINNRFNTEKDMFHRFGFRIHYYLVVFMVLVACATQVKDQESKNALPESAIKQEICILPHHSYHHTPADFNMHEFDFRKDADSIIPALKQLQEDVEIEYTSYLPQVPDWMSSKYAKDSLYRSAYLSFVQHYVDGYKRNGIDLSVLYVPREGRQIEFITLEELAAVVKCQICIVDSVPAVSQNNRWMIIEK